MTSEEENRQFELYADRSIAVAFEEGVIEFAHLLRSLPGLYPTDVVASLKRIFAADPRMTLWAQSLIAQAIGSGDDEAESARHFQRPTPHPLDFDWRFSPETASMLIEIVYGSASEAGRVLLLGTPSVFNVVKSNPAMLSRTILVDRNRSPDFGENRDHVLTADIAKEPGTPASFDVLLADPPWYPDHLRSFLWRASFEARNGASVYCGMPPEGARPGVAEERKSLLDWLEGAGLELAETHPLLLKYLTPPFERNALRAAGMHNIPDQWRRGDLAQFRRRQAPRIARPIATHLVETWSEIQWGPVRWRFRKSAVMQNADPRLETLVEGDILASVSRRNPIRDKANVWTSGNRVYGCRDPQMLCYLVEKIQSMGYDDVAVFDAIEAALGRSLRSLERDRIINASRQVVETQRLEVEEYGEGYVSSSI